MSMEQARLDTYAAYRKAWDRWHSLPSDLRHLVKAVTVLRNYEKMSREELLATALFERIWKDSWQFEESGEMTDEALTAIKAELRRRRENS